MAFKPLSLIRANRRIVKYASKAVNSTKNPAKLNRYKKLLADYKLELLSLSDVEIDDDIAETEPTIEGNSILKARFYHKLSRLPALAEDGGLVIKSLNGWPGVYSRRVWGPEEREATDEEAIQEVIKRIVDVTPDNRAAYFVAEVALVMPDGTVYLGHGEAHGRITTNVYPKIIKGFPYRSIFVPVVESKTVAVLEDEAIHKDYLPQRKEAIIKLEPYF